MAILGGRPEGVGDQGVDYVITGQIRTKDIKEAKACVLLVALILGIK